MSDSSEERTAAILTPAQRRLLTPGGEEKSGSALRAMHSRIRNRIYSGIHDGTILWQHLPVDEREKIFDAWHEDPFRNEEWGLFSQADQRRHDQFQHSLTCLLAFFYAGIEEADHLNFDFEEVLSDAVASAIRAQGGVVDEFEFTVETSESYNTEALLQRFKEGDPHLSQLEIQHLREEAGIDAGDLEDYYDRLTGNRGPIGMVDPNEIADEFDVVTDEE